MADNAVPLNGTTLLVRIDSIVLDPSTQVRVKADAKAITEYKNAMREGVQFPPLLVAQNDPEDVDKGFTLIDGWHRYRAYQGLDIDTIPVTISTETDPNRFPWTAARGNQQHGLRLSRADKVNVFKAYVKAGEHRAGTRGNRIKSAREMSRDLQGIVSHHQLPVWMQKYYPSIYRKMKGVIRDEVEVKRPWGHRERDEWNAKIAIEKLKEVKAAFHAIRDMELRKDLQSKFAGLWPKGFVDRDGVVIGHFTDDNEDF